MATLMWQRDIASDASDVKNTFSSWDNCMSEAYCKWPVIAAIICGSIIALSLIWCCARCLCCGVECCCGCFACCNSCCPSPRGRRNEGYQQPPPPPQFQQYPQYASPAPPMYAGGGYRGAPPTTATYDNPIKSPVATSAPHYNEDALPAMPSWSHAQERRIQDNEVEMEKFDHSQHAQQQSLLPQYDSNRYGQQSPYQQSPHPDQAYGGDIGSMHASPYHNYNDQRQMTASPSIYSQPTVNHGDSSYAPRNQAMSPVSAYEPSVYPPSYHTQAPPGLQIGRKPINGSWRDV